MNSAAEDVLLHIFGAYVHGLKQSPTRLLLVNHRWHSLLASTSSLWTSVTVYIKSSEAVRRLLYDDGVEDNHGPLDRYLARSVPTHGGPGLPLDISIKWGYPNFRLKEYKFPKKPDALPPWEGYEIDILLVQRVIDSLQGYKSWLGKQHPLNARGTHELQRWRSFEIYMEHFQGRYEGFTTPSITLGPAADSMITCAPILEKLVFRDIGIVAKFYTMPRLRYLQVHRDYLHVYPGVSGLEHLTITGRMHIQGATQGAMILCYLITPSQPYDRREQIGNGQWERLVNLRSLHLINCFNSVPPPFSHTLPNICDITLERSVSSEMLLELGRRFNYIQPLETLTIVSDLRPFVDCLRIASDLRVDVLKLGSDLFERSKRNYSSGGYGYYTSADARVARDLLEEARKRHFKVVALDLEIYGLLKAGEGLKD